MIQLPPIGYENDYTVQTYDIDSQKRMTPGALVRMMQEASMQNVIELKLSVWDLEKHQISWVLLRQHLHIARLPVFGERLKVVTYGCGFEKFLTYRDYKVFDGTENLIAYSASAWLLMNTLERRIVKLPDFILAFESRFPAESECLPRPESKVPALGSVHHSKPFWVNWHDLDFNGHLNNVHYIEWMLEALPDDVLKERKLVNMDVIYKVEANWHDELLSEVQVLGEDKFLHRLIRVSDRKELAVAMSEFE